MNLPEFLIQDTTGEIRLAGHRIGLYTVVRSYQEGNSAEEIAAECPSLALDLVRKVIAYYLNNRTEVEGFLNAYQAELDREVAASVPGPGLIRIRHLMEKLRTAETRHEADPGWSSLSIVEKLRKIEREEGAETV